MPRTTTPLAAAAVALSLVAAAPAGAATVDPPRPIARAAGSDVPPTIPSLIQTRITRVENAIDRLTAYIDDEDAAGADRTGKVIRRQLSAAWRGATYYIKNPPPAAGEDSDDDDGPVVADPATAAFAVFEAYHSVAATVGQLIDGARVPVLDSMSHTLFWTLDSRDKAVAAARTLEPPVDPEAEVDDEAATLATVMPGVTKHIDDEVQQIRGLQADAADLTPGGARMLSLAMAQSVLTAYTVNQFWPPVVED